MSLIPSDLRKAIVLRNLPKHKKIFNSPGQNEKPFNLYIKYLILVVQKTFKPSTVKSTLSKMKINHESERNIGEWEG